VSIAREGIRPRKAARALVALGAMTALSACSATTTGPAALSALADARAAALALPSEPPAVLGAVPLAGDRAEGRSRPSAHAREIDLDSIPLARWTSPTDPRGFVLSSHGDSYNLVMQAPYFAEVSISPIAGVDWTGSPFVAFTGYSFVSGETPPCNQWRQLGVLPARWMGFSVRGWTDDSIDAEVADADFSLVSCRGRPRLVAKARARALLPRFAYALRVKAESSGPSSDERLVVFLPYGHMVSTTGDPSDPLAASDIGSFTRLSLPLRPGGTSAAAIRVSAGAMRVWRDIRAGRIARAPTEESSPSDELLVELDVAWQGAKKTALISVALPKGVDPKAYAAAAMTD
jgi:hypothetical protein